MLGSKHKNDKRDPPAGGNTVIIRVVLYMIRLISSITDLPDKYIALIT